MNMKHVAELIILQCIEDLWNKEEAGESIAFFQGEGFALCAEVAGIDLRSQSRVLEMVRGIKSALTCQVGTRSCFEGRLDTIPGMADHSENCRRVAVAGK